MNLGVPDGRVSVAVAEEVRPQRKGGVCADGSGFYAGYNKNPLKGFKW